MLPGHFQRAGDIGDLGSKIKLPPPRHLAGYMPHILEACWVKLFVRLSVFVKYLLYSRRALFTGSCGSSFLSSPNNTGPFKQRLKVLLLHYSGDENIVESVCFVFFPAHSEIHAGSALVIEPGGERWRN